jgi:hypothetical protein
VKKLNHGSENNKNENAKNPMVQAQVPRATLQALRIRARDEDRSVAAVIRNILAEHA